VPAVMWFRRDLRLSDNPALLAAIAEATTGGDGQVVPLFVIDPHLWSSSGPSRQAYLVATLERFGASLDRNLYIRYGDPREIVPEVASLAGATHVHIAAEFTPYARARDAAVERALAQLPSPAELVRTGSPYAVAPGRVLKDDGTPYRVYTPFYKAWLRHGWRAPAVAPGDVEWFMPTECEGRPAVPDLGGMVLPDAGEAAALQRWETFRDEWLAEYADARNRPDLAGTSRLSTSLKWGEIHPRTLLSDLDDSTGADIFRKEIAWREFYADVLHHHPRSAREPLDPKWSRFPWNIGPDADAAFAAWSQGRTGYPVVDAGMRQLLAEGWMHNRVRMITASFLVKDLHLDWRRGAAWFMRHLSDADVASNQQGWQWVAGSGTDAAPYYRIFNPVVQGQRFDPAGDYVRRYVPELRHIAGAGVHEPWLLLDGTQQGYPDRIVDHAHERDDAMARYEVIKQVAD
jgi:deoxyribodipyrimidine photo-lyase